MRPEKSRLIHELLEGTEQQGRREAALLAGRRALRHRRWRRTAFRAGMFVVVAFSLATLPIYYRMTHRAQPFAAAPTPKPAVRYLTDDQLLALFPNTPVGLAKVGNRKVLIFPRAIDEERYIGKF